MSDRYFIDTNIFLYAIEETGDDRQHQAARWLDALLVLGLGCANLQVMNEITNVLLRRGGQPTENVFTAVDRFSAFGTAPVNFETVAAARLIRFETNYGWWDCVLLASAIEHGCRRFLSEDLQDGRSILGLTIVNPFRHSPPEIPYH